MTDHDTTTGQAPGRMSSLRTALRQSCNTINYAYEEAGEASFGVRIGRLVVLIGKPYGTHNACDNHVGWTPLSIRWQLPFGPR